MGGDIEIMPASNGRLPEVSLQVYQQVYNDLTGKNEHIRRLWLDAHVIRVSDIEQLHQRLEQCAEQYALLSSHCQVSVRNNTHESERYSSFEKFIRTGLGKNSATEEVEIVYDFLLKLPRVEEAKPYRIELGLRSEIGVVDGFRKHNVSETEVRLFHEFTSGKARMDISYIDLAVARSFEATISNWYDGLEKSREQPFQGFMKYLAPSVGLFSRISAIVVAAVFLSFSFSSNINENSDLYRLGLMSVAVLYIVNLIAIKIANMIEKSIKSRRPLAAILLSQQDQVLLDAQRRQIFKSIGSSIFGILGSILISLIATYIARIIGL